MKSSSVAGINPGSSSQDKRPKRRLLIVSLVLAASVLLALGLLPFVSPDVSAAVADRLRTWLGPQPVAELESISFQMQDWMNQLRYRAGYAQPQLSWEPTSAPPTPPAQQAEAAISPTAVDTPTPADNGSTSLLTPAPEATPTDVPATATPTSTPETAGRLPGANLAFNPSPTPSPSQGTWQSFGSSPAESQVLARTVLYPDPARPYSQAAIVRMDLTRTTLHLVPGTVDPIAAPGTAPFPRPGIIPLNVQSSGTLLAAFNGGFKAINGAYGMFANGATILPPQKGLATVAIYSDGSVKMGAWGRDLTQTPNLVAFRQNCPLLVDAGSLNPDVANENPREWGYTIRNSDVTWRSGLGLSADGHTLYYVVGASLTVETLARALQTAGAYYAMQLDINPVWTRFVTYRSLAPNRLLADKLLSQMAGTTSQFLSPDNRDFFYLTLR